MPGKAWIAVLGTPASIVAVRSGLREVPVTRREGPSVGDRVAVMTLPSALLVGSGTVGYVRPGGVLLLRDRVRAPAGHAVDPYALAPAPAFATDVPRDRLPSLADTPVELSDRDRVRLCAALRAQALSFGPIPAARRARPRVSPSGA